MQGATPRLVQWVYDKDIFAGVTIFEDAAMWADGADKVRSTFRVGWLHEPQALHPHYYDKAVEVRHQFDCILTHYQPLIDAYPDTFRFTIHGGVSVPVSEWGMHVKSRDVAMLLSDKRMTANHQLRHQIAAEVEGIDVYRNLYGEAKIQTLKNYRFVVVVENASEPNWWTEHVLDPIALGCVPLYYWTDAMNEGLQSFRRYANGAFWPFRSLEALQRIMRKDDVDRVDDYYWHRTYLRTAQESLPEWVTPEDWFVQHAIAEMCEMVTA